MSVSCLLLAFYFCKAHWEDLYREGCGGRLEELTWDKNDWRLAIDPVVGRDVADILNGRGIELNEEGTRVDCIDYWTKRLWGWKLLK